MKEIGIEAKGGEEKDIGNMKGGEEKKDGDKKYLGEMEREEDDK